MNRAGIVGLGLLGTAVASRLLQGGVEVTGYDVRAEQTRALASAGLRAAENTAGACEGAEAVFTILPTLESVEEVLCGPAGVLEAAPKDAVIVQMSTISPELARRMGGVAASRGYGFLDAPISGTSAMVAARDCTLLVGGDPAHLECCRPLFAAIARRTVHMGEVGTASLAKLATNLLVALNTAAVAEALVLGAAGGLDKARLLDAWEGTAASSCMMEIRGPLMAEGRYPPQMKLDLFMKDLHLMLEEGRRLEAPLPLTEVAERLYAAAADAGRGSEDLASVMTAVESLASRTAGKLPIETLNQRVVSSSDSLTWKPRSMPRHTVAVTDHLFPSMDDEARMFREMDTELVIGQCKGEDDVIALCREADAILNTYARMTPRVIESLERCRVIVRFGIGYDNVDVEAATRYGIMVANTTEYCIDEVADQAMAMLLACGRGLFPAGRIARDGTWDLGKMPVLRRLSGQTLGLVGIGQIGKAVAARAHGFGLRVLASDPYVDEAAARELGAELTDLDTLLAAADYVSVHVPLMSATEGMINAAVFAKMKPTAFLINVARGRIVNQADLVRAVRRGDIAGAGLDVLEQEPPEAGDAITSLDNVILTPHSAWLSEEARADMRRRAVGQVVSVLKGELPYSLINREVVQSNRA